MDATSVDAAPAEAPGLPDYLLNPDAVLGDVSANWRHGQAPDYSQTRKVYEQSMSSIFLVIHNKYPTPPVVPLFEDSH